MNITQRLNELAHVLEAAKPRALGGGAIIDREKALRLLAEIRAAVPTEIQEAQDLVLSADQTIAAAQAKAESILAQAQARVDIMVTGHEVAIAAEERAAQLVARADEVAAHKQLEVDAYVESKLASFEGNLTATLQSVQHGRQKLASVRLPDVTPVTATDPAVVETSV